MLWLDLLERAILNVIDRPDRIAVRESDLWYQRSIADCQLQVGNVRLQVANFEGIEFGILYWAEAGKKNEVWHLAFGRVRGNT